MKKKILASSVRQEKEIKALRCKNWNRRNKNCYSYIIIYKEITKESTTKSLKQGSLLDPKLIHKINYMSAL